MSSMLGDAGLAQLRAGMFGNVGRMTMTCSTRIENSDRAVEVGHGLTSRCSVLSVGATDGIPRFRGLWSIV